MLVRWTQPAADDLLHICDYTAERFGAAQARRVADAISDLVHAIRQYRKLADQKPLNLQGSDYAHHLLSPPSLLP
jgi:plasmid stabilization system protein ParE